MVKKIVSYTFTFLLIILLLISVSVTIISQTIAKEQFILEILNRNNYIARTYYEIVETFKDNTIQSGLEESVLQEIITENQVKQDIETFVKYVYNGMPISIDTQKIKIKLQENIEVVIRQNNKKISKEEQSAIDTYIAVIENIYEEGIVFSKQYIESIQSIVTKVQAIIYKVQITLYIVTLILTVLILIINKKQSLKYFSIAILAVGIILIIPKIIESNTMQVQNILLFNLVVSDVIIDIIETILSYFLITGIIACIIGLILIIISSIIEKKN